MGEHPGGGGNQGYLGSGAPRQLIRCERWKGEVPRLSAREVCARNYYQSVNIEAFFGQAENGSDDRLSGFIVASSDL